MGEILCVGATHYPGLRFPDEAVSGNFRRHLANEGVPAEWKDPKNWPEGMRQEFGPDGENAVASAAEHRRRVIGAYRKVRQEIDAFNPDFIVIWGDDQYENFKEDIVPPFCVLIYDEFEMKPHANSPSWRPAENAWGEPRDKTFVVKGHPEGGRYLARRLLEEDLCIPYAYKPLHFEGVSHAFLNTLLYLDYDRTGFDYPIVPFHVNCYGSRLISRRGGDAIGENKAAAPDPPAPSPRQCFDVGAMTARVLKESPYRVVLMGSSSWSHAFLTDKHYFLYPDLEADQARFEELRDGKQHLWRDLKLADIEQNGQHELLNWIPLAGAITELGYQVEVLDFVTTYIFNSSKCAIVAKPPGKADKTAKAAAEPAVR